MGKGYLDKKLLDKIADKLGRRRQAVNVMVSKRASNLGISSEAALILIAKENNIGAAWYQRKLDPEKQREVRENFPAVFARQRTETKKAVKPNGRKRVAKMRASTILKAAVEYLLEDDELRKRCTDLLLARSRFDRAINQATLVLEDRIRTKAQPSQSLVGEALVNYAFKEDLSRTVLRISTNAEEQRGFTHIIRGVVPAFRNITHHHVTNKFSKKDASRVCAFIDVLLKVVDNSVKVR